MTFTAPTRDDLKTRFPRFAGADNDAIDAALADAALVVDDSWLSQADFTTGRLLYAAHILVLDGHGSGFASQAAAAGLDNVRTVRSADLTITKQDEGGAVSTDILKKTNYGQRFIEIRRRNVRRPIAAVKAE